MRSFNRNEAVQVTVLLLRVAAAFIFLQTGGLKLFGWFGGMPGGFKVPLMSELGAAGVLEFFGGIAILLGIFTRPIAFILSGEMAVAYWQGHAPISPWTVISHGEGALLLCFIFLFLAAYGGGRWSVDAWLRAKRRASGEINPVESPPI